MNYKTIIKRILLLIVILIIWDVASQRVNNLFGIDPTRIIAQCNGSSKPMYDNDTEEHRALNRRTDVSFKIIE